LRKEQNGNNGKGKGDDRFLDKSGHKKEKVDKKEKRRVEGAGGKDDQVNDEGNKIDDRQAAVAKDDKKDGEEGDGLRKEVGDRGEG